jgi:hypothetical protein
MKLTEFETINTFLNIVKYIQNEINGHKVLSIRILDKHH